MEERNKIMIGVVGLLFVGFLVLIAFNQFLFGFALIIIAVILFNYYRMKYIVKPIRQLEKTVNENLACPYCGKTVKSDYITCPFCKKDLKGKLKEFSFAEEMEKLILFQ